MSKSCANPSFPWSVKCEEALENHQKSKSWVLWKTFDAISGFSKPISGFRKAKNLPNPRLSCMVQRLDAPIDPFSPEGPAMGWTAATRRGRFCAAAESPLEGWEGAWVGSLEKKYWERVTSSGNMLRKNVVFYSSTGKKGRGSNNTSKQLYLMGFQFIYKHMYPILNHANFRGFTTIAPKAPPPCVDGASPCPWTPGVWCGEIFLGGSVLI